MPVIQRTFRYCLVIPRRGFIIPTLTFNPWYKLKEQKTSLLCFFLAAWIKNRRSNRQVQFCINVWSVRIIVYCYCVFIHSTAVSGLELSLPFLSQKRKFEIVNIFSVSNEVGMGKIFSEDAIFTDKGLLLLFDIRIALLISFFYSNSLLFLQLTFIFFHLWIPE